MALHLFVPLDFSYIQGYPSYLHFQLWKEHALKFLGNPLEASKSMEFLIEFLPNLNMVLQDVTMKMFALPLMGKLYGNVPMVSSRRIYSLLDILLKFSKKIRVRVKFTSYIMHMSWLIFIIE